MSATKNNVLIIDDDIGMMQAMNVVLKSYGINLTTFTEPLPALQELKTNKHDILIISYLLSSVKGDEIVKLVREFDKEIYIILMSAHKELAPSVDIMRSLDIQAFFEKGARFDDLILLIESGYKYVQQMNSIKEMSVTIENFGIEFATVLKNTVGAKDNYTKEHSDRVSLYSEMFAKHLGLDEETTKTLTLAANFHDIGKIGIADAVLLKKGPLSDEEYRHIKLHPVIGENILSTSEIFKSTLPTIRHHHERYDGSGYPDKLSGENIPYLARVLSICDTFDAMTSVRVYRDKMPLEKVFSEMEKSKNVQLDPMLTDQFLKLIKENLKKISEIIDN